MAPCRKIEWQPISGPTVSSVPGFIEPHAINGKPYHSLRASQVAEVNPVRVQGETRASIRMIGQPSNHGGYLTNHSVETILQMIAAALAAEKG